MLTEEDRKKRIASGKRLEMAINERFKNDSRFIEKAQQEGSHIDSGNLARTKKGQRKISKDDLPIFCKLLKVDRFYLMGDLPDCSDFYDYARTCEHGLMVSDLLNDSEEKYEEYKQLFDAIGGFLLDRGDDRNDNLEYGLYRISDGECRDFSPIQMEVLVNDIKQLANERFYNHISNGYTPQTPEEYERAKEQDKHIKEYLSKKIKDSIKSSERGDADD